VNLYSQHRYSKYHQLHSFSCTLYAAQHLTFLRMALQLFSAEIAIKSNGSDTLESFLSKVAFESNLRKKLSRIEHVLIVKVSFERRKIANVFMTRVQVFFQKSLSKATFKRKLSSVSLA